MRRLLSFLMGLFVTSLTVGAFAQSFDASKTYTISNNNDANMFMQDNGTGQVALGGKNDNSYWKFVPTTNTDCYFIQNVATGKFIQGYTASEQEVATGDAGVEYYVKADATGDYTGKFRMSCTANSPYNFNNGTLGLNWKDNNTVQSFASVASGNPRSAWILTEATVPAGLVLPAGAAEPVDGEYYVYNVQHEKYIVQSNEYATRAGYDRAGIVITVDNLDNGTLTLITNINGAGKGIFIANGNGETIYTDNTPTEWTFECIDAAKKIYTLKNGDAYLQAKTGQTRLEAQALPSDKSAQWMFIPKSVRQDLSGASESNPIDVTYLIENQGFDRFNGEQNSWKNADNSNWRPGDGWCRNADASNNCAEVWNANFNIHQTFENQPNGIYELRIKGYYRISGGNNSDELISRITNNNPDIQRTKYYINDSEGALLPQLSTTLPAAYADDSRTINGTTYRWPNGKGKASIAFLNGYYENEPIRAIVNDGKITIGLKLDNKNGEDWNCFDDVRLYYLGIPDVSQYTQALEEAISAAEAFSGNTTTALANALSTALSEAIAVRNSVDTDELSAKTTALNQARSAAESVDITILSATILLANADGANTSAAEAFVENGTSASEMNTILAALRIARRVANADKDNNNYTGNEPVGNGEFYLYNVGQKRFFCGGDSWGAHAAIGFPGIVVTLEASGEDFKINTHLQNGDGEYYLNYGGYCDTGTQSLWKFVQVSVGVYNIARQENTSNLLGYSNNTYNRVDTDKSDASNPDNQWILVTKADRDAILATATETAPQDASYLIKSPGFSQREVVSAWTMTGGAEIWGRGSDHPDFAIEAYDKTAAGVEQTVENLPPGTYELKVQAFYRDGNFAKQVEIASGGGELKQLATLYAGTKSAPIQNVVNGADKAPGMGRASAVGYMPDGIDDACLYFQSGLYWASLDEIVVGQDGKMTIGARKTEKLNGGDWMVLDNFRLIYKGMNIDLTGVKADLLAKIGEANDLLNNLGLDLTYLKDAKDAGQDVYDNSTDADEIVNATNALQAAINATENVTDLTVFKKTVALATTEGVDTSAEKAAVEAVDNSDNVASVVSAQLYNVRAARKVKALGKADIYTGAAPAEGKVYLFNLGTGMFLGMGSDWNTHAAIDQVGIEVELVASGDGFIMKSAHGSFNAGEHGPYVDTGANAVFTFTAVSGKENTYTIKQGDLVLGWNPNADTDGKHYWNTIANTAGADVADANFQWKVITADERATLEAAASSTNAVDVSYKINNASLFRKPGYDMWQKERDGGNSAQVSTVNDNDGNRAADFAYEYFEPLSFSFTQKVTGLKPGNYKVSVQGFYRDGNGDNQANIVNNGGELLQKAYLVGNNAQAYLPNIATVTDLVPGIGDLRSSNNGEFPNMPQSAIEFFEHGAYLTTVDAVVGSNGELTIGVKKDERPNTGDWVVLDNFRLYYLGAPYGINTMSIMGDFTGGWDFADNQHMTQDADDPNIWTLTVDNFKPEEAKSYIYKATANEAWDVYEYPQGNNNNQDWYFGSAEYPTGSYYKLVFTMNTKDHVLTLNVTKKTVVTIAENETFVPADQTDVTIVLNRLVVGNDTWNTFCVPFNISNDDLKAQFGDDVKVAEFSETAEGENSTVNFNTMQTPAVTANVPVLLKSNTTATSFVFGGDIVAGEAKVAGVNFDFVGTAAASTTIAEGDYFLANNKLYKSKGSTTIAGTRAYLKVKADGARVVNVFFDGDNTVTGIDTLDSLATGQSGSYYDLQGRKLSNGQVKKGVYVVDGKKIVIK